jgi:iduronate 2-sulfatase
VCIEHWRYTEWRNENSAVTGAKLYDQQNDPHQWQNLANDARHAKTKKAIAALLPKTNAPAAR